MPAPSECPTSPFLTNAEAAALIRLSRRTLDSWRCAGRGPRFLRLGSRVVYRLTDVLAWIETRERQSTADTGATRP